MHLRWHRSAYDVSGVVMVVWSAREGLSEDNESTTITINLDTSGVSKGTGQADGQLTEGLLRL